MTLDIKFGKYIEDAFKIWKENLGLMAGIGAITALLGSLCFIVLPIVIPSAMAIAFALVDGRQPKPVIGEMFKTQWFLPVLIYALLMFVITLVVYGLLSLIFCIGIIFAPLVGLAMAGAFSFVLPFIVDRNMDAITAMKASWALAKPNFFPILGLALVAGLIAQAGSVACGIGVVLTAPLYFLIIAAAYRDLMAQTAPPAPAPAAVPPPPAG